MIVKNLELNWITAYSVLSQQLQILKLITKIKRNKFKKELVNCLDMKTNIKLI
jgi:hypothetical protein